VTRPAAVSELPHRGHAPSCLYRLRLASEMDYPLPSIGRVFELVKYE